MRFVSLFSGIGGLELGLERAGMECVAQVENDPWCTAVLEKHWPSVPRWQDIHDLDPEELPDHDLIAGGFPCQPVSLAGGRLAQDDPRWLWPEFFRVVRLVRPRYILVENVPGLASGGMGDVLGDLAAVRYDTEWTSIPAAAVGAPHLRWRIFVVAYPRGAGSGGQRRVAFDSRIEAWRPGETRRALVRPKDGSTRADRAWEGGEDVADAANPDGRENSTREATKQGDGFVFGGGVGRKVAGRDWWAVEPDVGRVAHGVPRRVDRLRGLGNAVVPQVAELVGRMILEADG
jgi:DNA (cytosine-5)-methyltransferase 1